MRASRGSASAALTSLRLSSDLRASRSDVRAARSDPGIGRSDVPATLSDLSARAKERIVESWTTRRSGRLRPTERCASARLARLVASPTRAPDPRELDGRSVHEDTFHYPLDAFSSLARGGPVAPTAARGMAAGHCRSSSAGCLWLSSSVRGPSSGGANAASPPPTTAADHARGVMRLSNTQALLVPRGPPRAPLTPPRTPRPKSPGRAPSSRETQRAA